MPNLKSIVSQYADNSRKLGDNSEVNLSEQQTQQLRQELAKLSSKNNIFFWICATMVLVVFVGSLWLVLQYINNPEKIQTIFTASGLSIGGLIFYMNKLWKEKVSTDLLLVLVATLQKETLNSVMVALISKL